MWIRPEMYFLSNKLLRARNGAILNDGEQDLNLEPKYIPPFKKEILDFFSPTEIREKLLFNYREDSGVVRFSFTLPIGNSSYKIEKTYKQKASLPSEGEIMETDVPIIEIFPNYLGESWRRYYLFQGMAESYFINPILEDKKPVRDYRERDFKDADTSQKVRVYEIIGDKAFPEAAEDHGHKGMALGLILISKKENIQGLKHTWTLGIDFGTSNTNVYKNRGSADSAERWVYDFPQYYRTLTLSDPSNGIRSWRSISSLRVK